MNIIFSIAVKKAKLLLCQKRYFFLKNYFITFKVLDVNFHCHVSFNGFNATAKVSDHGVIVTFPDG